MMIKIRSVLYSRRPKIDVLVGKDGSRCNFVTVYTPDLSTFN